MYYDDMECDACEDTCILPSNAVEPPELLSELYPSAMHCLSRTATAYRRAGVHDFIRSRESSGHRPPRRGAARRIDETVASRIPHCLRERELDGVARCQIFQTLLLLLLLLPPPPPPPPPLPPLPPARRAGQQRTKTASTQTTPSKQKGGS